MKDNAKFNAGEPGIGLEVARWCVAKQLALVGADTWATEVVPNPDPDLVFVVHNELITKNGIYNHENLDFTELLEGQGLRVRLRLRAAPHQGRHRLRRPPDRDRLATSSAPGPIGGPGASFRRGAGRPARSG